MRALRAGLRLGDGLRHQISRISVRRNQLRLVTAEDGRGETISVEQ